MVEINGREIRNKMAVMAVFVGLITLFLSIFSMVSAAQPNEAYRIVRVPTVAAQLMPENGQQHWVEVGLSLEFMANTDPDQVDAKISSLVDAVRADLEGLQQSEFRGTEGTPALFEALEKHIFPSIRAVFPRGELNDILLRELMIYNGTMPR